MPLTDLNATQAGALLSEVTSARNLLAYGVRTVRTAAFIETTRDPVLTMLSIGVEKLYKLTLGLVRLDEQGQWPTKGQMKAIGHGSAEMHLLVMGALGRRAAGKSQYVRSLVEDVESDPVVGPVIDTLDLYGRMGRFYYLDQLGDSPQDVNPDDLWQKIEDAALTLPDVALLHERTFAHLQDRNAYQELLEALNERTALAVERVWLAIAAAGINGALGATGVLFGHEVHPDAVGRQ